MDEIIKCPYCGGDMDLLHYSDCICYSCAECLSESPSVSTYLETNLDEVYDLARRLAIKRT